MNPKKTKSSKKKKIVKASIDYALIDDIVDIEMSDDANLLYEYCAQLMDTKIQQQMVEISQKYDVPLLTRFIKFSSTTPNDPQSTTDNDEHPQKQIIEYIKRSKKVIFVGMYSYKDKAIWTALIQQKKDYPELEVYLLLNTTKVSPEYPGFIKVLEELTKHGFRVKSLDLRIHPHLFHVKIFMTLIEEFIYSMIGSSNASPSAANDNWELNVTSSKDPNHGIPSLLVPLG